MNRHLAAYQEYQALLRGLELGWGDRLKKLWDSMPCDEVFQALRREFLWYDFGAFADRFTEHLDLIKMAMNGEVPADLAENAVVNWTSFRLSDLRKTGRLSDVSIQSAQDKLSLLVAPWREQGVSVVVEQTENGGAVSIRIQLIQE